MKHLLSLKYWSKEDIIDTIDLALKIKKSPKKYESKLKGKTLLMIFSKASLRTRLSFEIGMNKLGGKAIFYDLSHSTLGKKESIKDFIKVVGRYVDIVMARLYEHEKIEEMAKYSSVPIINGLTNAYHPCQIIGDLMTIKEHLNNLDKANITFYGDCNNNVAHSLIIAANKLNIHMNVSHPNKIDFVPNKKYIDKNKFETIIDPKKAALGSNVIYTDTWMSYHIPENKMKKRIKLLRSFQVNQKIMECANKNSIFMHCLPAKRGMEVTNEVMDSEKSVIYDQAENRMWAEMAIMLKLKD